jgi:hypothetical protein
MNTSRRNKFEKNRSSDVKRSQLASKKNNKINRHFISINPSNLPQSFVRITSIDIIVLHPSRNKSFGTVPVEQLSVFDEFCCIQTNERSSNL